MRCLSSFTVIWGISFFNMLSILPERSQQKGTAPVMSRVGSWTSRGEHYGLAFFSFAAGVAACAG
jgi:hypothetical protein